MTAETAKQFFEDNEDYVEVRPDPANPTVGNLHEFDELEDDVWIMQVPRGFDVGVLKGEKLKFPGRTTVELEDEEFEALSVELEKPQKRAAAFSSRKGVAQLKLLPVRGSVVVRKKLKANAHLSAKEIVEAAATKSLIPKKPMIKIRHPLLGSMFQDEFKKVPAHVTERLKNADAISMQVAQEARQKFQSLKRSRTESTGKSAVLPVKQIKKEISDDDDEVEFVSETKTKKQKKAKRSKKDADVSEDLQWIKDL